MVLKDKQIKVEIEMPEWLIKRAGTAGCNTRRTLEDELGREAFTRLVKESKK